MKESRRERLLFKSEIGQAVTKDNKQLGKKAENQPNRKAAAYLHSATSYAPDDLQYPAMREQAELISAFAEKNSMDIVKTYIDSGKCGANARAGLRNMIEDVQSGTAEYDVILMRDITRWGRERMDEAAYYEFICRRAGFDVQYMNEPFKNDGSVISSIIKTIKRGMEGEYRRERAAKAKAARLRRKARKAGAPAETEVAHE